MDKRSKLIQNEIDRLSKKSESASGLTLEDLKKLDLLIKNDNLIKGEPTEISRQINEDEFTDDDILAVLEDRKKKRDDSKLNS